MRALGGGVIVLIALGVVSSAFPLEWMAFPAIGLAVVLGGALRARSDAQPRAPARLRRGPTARARALPAGNAREHGVLPRAVLHAERSETEIEQLIAGLAEADRALIPEVMPVVRRLVDRIRFLGEALARVDSAVAPGAVAVLDNRIAQAEASSDAIGARTLTLLQRQRESLQDLVDRRAVLRAQLDSASLALENLHLQLIKLRSAGVQSAIENVTSATQEARALEREIGHVLDAASELRVLDRRERDGD